MSESVDQPIWEQSHLIAQVESSSRVNREESGLPTAVPIAGAIFGVILVVWFLKNFLRICNPNEILILSGRKHRTKGGQTVGYRVIFGGRVISIPLLESVKIMDMTTMPVPVEVKNAYSKGGTPLDIQAIANVKISNDPGVVGNAIERFLDRDRKEILRVARETLEGNLRGVVALLTPEQINEDRLRFAEQIAQDVSRELVKLGLQLDTLKIQSVADDVDYLSSIGRRQIAQIVRDAEIAESNAMGEAERIEADCQQQSEVAQTQALAIVQEKQNALRKIKAELEQRAKSEEERTIAAGKEARARAEQQLQAMRADLERLRLEADEVLPAEAQRQAKELQSRGEAASLGENAKAAAQVNDMLSKVWEETGTDAAEVFLIQQIEMVLRQAAEIPNRVKLERINVIDNGDGQAIASLVNAYPEMVRQFLDRVDQTLGIDVTGTLKAQNKNQGE
ncbi:flotillin family protein [Acaryochloris marina]|uniref:flotillin family protein n=1 Tax=Acaryochloris marina TaxID=155978 RepID=UPI001BAFC552|nr:SPFH domain-containing protein [Acaryochloris marina]QUY40993.1 flotillin family protein [Acaryochloris marina S15]